LLVYHSQGRAENVACQASLALSEARWNGMQKVSVFELICALISCTMIERKMI
jgi:hypothetical protein